MAALAGALLASGCSLVLDDPQAFQPRGSATDVGTRSDAARPDAELMLDFGQPPPPDMGQRFDVGGRFDRGPRPDEGTDDLAVPDAEQCVAETCNGLDDDCDGRTDEMVSDQCGACAPLDQRGACQKGVFYCIGGVLQCVPMPPVAANIVACNLVDDDCDGRVDEAAEGEAPRTALGASALIACGPPPAAEPNTYGGCVDEDPGTVGCGGAHACRDADCIAGCHATRAAADAACTARCPAGGTITERSACLLTCRTEADTARRNCITICPGSVATRFACEGGDQTAVCTALDCPMGQVADERDCVDAPPGMDLGPSADLGADAEVDAGPP